MEVKWIGQVGLTISGTRGGGSGRRQWSARIEALLESTSRAQWYRSSKIKHGINETCCRECPGWKCSLASLNQYPSPFPIHCLTVRSNHGFTM